MTTQTQPILEPATRAFIDGPAAQGGKPLYELSYQDARKVLEDAQSTSVTKLPADIEDEVLPVGPGGEVSVAQFPVPTEQDYAATKYIAEHGKEFGLDSSRLAIAGDSVGGNMAAVVAQLAKERKGPTIRYQVLFYPVTDTAMNTGSYSEFADGRWLTKPAMKWFWDADAPNPQDRRKTTASPLSATVEQLKDLPPALVIVDENDVLRDEGEAYVGNLIEAFHDFVMLNGLADTPASKSAIQLAAQKLRDVFGK